MVFDRLGNVQYGNYVFGLVALVSLGPLFNYIPKYFAPPFIMGAVFTIWSFTTLAWCNDFSFSLTRAITVALMQLIFLITASYSFMAERFLRVSVYSILIGAGILFVLTLWFLQMGLSLSLLQTEARTVTSIMDDNLIGRMLSFGSLVSLFLYLRRKKVLYIAIYLLFSLLILILKTKGGLLSLLVGTFILLFEKYYNDKKLSRFVGLVSVLVFIFMGIYSTGIFGDAFIRIENMFGFFSSSSGIVDESTFERVYFIQYGFDLFKSHPLGGYGIGAANYLLQGNYFHNNYIQLLVETGLVGFTLFYATIIWLIIKLWKYRKQGDCMLYFAIMVVLLFSDISNTTYYAKINYIFMGLSYISIQAARSEY